MSVSIDLSEVNALSARMMSAGGRVTAAGSSALRRVASDIEADARALAPVDTGNLRDSISTTLAGDGRSSAMSVEVGPSADYGVYVEYGTSTQPGTPFMGPAFDRRAPGYSAALADLAAREL